MSAPESTAPLPSALRSSSMKPSDMSLPLIGEKLGRTFTCGISRKKPGPAAIAAFFELEGRVRRPHRLAGAVIRDQCGWRRETLCWAFLMHGFGIGGVTPGLTVGLSCCSGSIEVIWLQAAHL